MKEKHGFVGRLALAGVGAALLSVALLGTGVTAEAGPAPHPAQEPDGARIYATFCSTCHQGSGEGVPGMFPPLAGSEWVTGDEARLIRVILDGLTGEIEVGGEVYSGTMPPWKGALKDAEIAALATYLRSSWGNEAPAVESATVARIRRADAARNRMWTAAELQAGDGRGR